MNYLFDHHAFLITGNTEQNCSALLKFLEEDKQIKLKGNPDAWIRKYDVLKIVDARELVDWQIRHAFSKEEKILIISADIITTEAQNALLKIFEEPKANTAIFLIVPSADSLLPTLCSRLNPMVFGVRELGSGHDQIPTSIDVIEFMSMSSAERIDALLNLIRKKDKSDALTFLEVLTKAIKNQKKPEEWNSEDLNALETLNLYQGHLRDTASSLKMILETVALVLPRF